MAERRARGRLLAAVVAFLVVGGGVYLAGLLAATLLRYVILPLVAVASGWLAARVAYRAGGGRRT